MRRLPHQREALILAALLAAGFAMSAPARAESPKLLVACQKATGAGKPVAACDVRAAGFAEFTEVKAKVKGRSEDLEVKFSPWQSKDLGSATLYLVQVLAPSRRRTLSDMADAVVALADQRKAKRRFSVYSFANDVSLIADSGSSKEEFARQVVALKPVSGSIELYKSALRAIEVLAKEPSERKSLVILGDGTSDDMGYTHDQVVKAARDAGVSIHALGYFDDKGNRPDFQTLSRLAEDTGGFAAEVKYPGKNRTLEFITGRFVPEVVENGGTLDVTLQEPTGPVTIALTGYLADGTTLTADALVEVAAASSAVPTTPSWTPSNESEALRKPKAQTGLLDWLSDWLEGKSLIVTALGAVLGLGLLALARAKFSPKPVENAAANGQVYGWLEALDGDRERHPLNTTNVRVGRHRDNDICLPNDSISRRHAVVHFNPETRRFVITDLGGGNGTVVNKTACKTSELNDGDIVELGDVRLRFRSGSKPMAAAAGKS